MICATCDQPIRNIPKPRPNSIYVMRCECGREVESETAVCVCLACQRILDASHWREA